MDIVNNIADARFDPNWRDDVFDEEALNFTLMFPQETARNTDIWVSSVIKIREDVFEKEYCHQHPRKIIAILKRSEYIASQELKDRAGNVLPKDSQLYDYMFPPKAWMSDTFQERCMMFAAAKVAQGKVLVAGLGLAVYPQLIFQMQRPVESITIIESNPTILQIIQKSWLDKLDAETKNKLQIIHGTIEDYLQNTTEQFDTIFLDTWEDGDSRYLPYINDLIQRALPHCLPTGKIYCWAYGLIVEVFIKNALHYASEKVFLDEYRLDPALEKYMEWLKENQQATPEEVELKAREIALTTVASFDIYQKQFCFTPYSTSRTEGAINRGMALKQTLHVYLDDAQ